MVAQTISRAFKPSTRAEFARCLESKHWRKNNLYTIVDESGLRCPYRQRVVQTGYARAKHLLNVILKSRQHGFSSEEAVDMVDDAVFTPDLQCGIIAHTKIDAQEIFETKVKLPYMGLPECIRRRNPAIKCDAGHLRLANGSSIRVAVSFRSATTHRLHVSELGKICSKYPKRAEEIITGTLPSVHPQLGGRATIEGTAEGGAGYFYDLCIRARADTIQAQKEGRELNPLQWKFHFYAWYQDPKNVATLAGVKISDELLRYFEQLAEKGIVTSTEQQAWYAFKKDGAGGLGKLMKREHPSTVEEAFESAVEGAVYGAEMDDARNEGRIGFYPWEQREPVYTFWDVGYNHATAIVFAQFIQGEIRIIDYYEVCGRGAAYHADQVMRKSYAYGTPYGPHDIVHHGKDSGIPLKDTYDSIFKERMPRFVATPRPKIKAEGLQIVSEVFPKFRIHQKGVEGNDNQGKGLLQAMSFYRFAWDETKQKFSKDPIDDWAADGADAVQTLALAYRFKRIGDRVLGSTSAHPEYRGRAAQKRRKLLEVA